ncbi:MAG: phosphoribosylpyrophosphate synthetase [Chitinophagales bacterium]|nr:phosphoribosylpyrophosphate synthetase [Chitinophagales bacterium]
MEINQYGTMVDAVNGLKAKGFLGDFNIDEEGLYVTDNKEKHFLAEEVEVVEFHRFEGMSDPGDMSIVYALQLTDGTKGILIDMFGTYSSAKVSEFFKHIGNIKHNEH